jgi:hypothetical protein
MQSQTQPLRLRELFAAVLALLLALALTAPLLGQDADPALEDMTDDEAMILVGPISFNENGDIVLTSTDEETGEVTTWIIAPASAFIPANVAEGDIVIIIGRLLPDGMTVQAITFEFFVEEEPEATPEMTPEPEATPEMTPEPEVTPEPVFETCGNANHPVAARLSQEFGVSQEEIVAMHCAGNGYGNIARALLLARAAGEGVTAWEYLERHQNGEGWGHIMRESGMHPSELAPGRIGKGRNDDDSDSEASMSTMPGNRGNGNRGGGNGNRGGGNENRGGGNENRGGGNGNRGGGRGNGGGGR